MFQTFIVGHLVIIATLGGYYAAAGDTRHLTTVGIVCILGAFIGGVAVGVLANQPRKAQRRAARPSAAYVPLDLEIVE